MAIKKKWKMNLIYIIQYLIKFTNNTEKLITRHKNVINGIFKGAGLQRCRITKTNYR